jgi:Tfp pilus assembly protein PilV
MNKLTYHNQEAQGLLEVIVALGIIISGIVGMVNLTISNQTATSEASDRLIATNFAREGIEVIRNIRDTNWLSCEINSGVLNCNDWDQGLSSDTTQTLVALFDVTNNSWTLNYTASDFNHNHTRIWRRNAGVADEIGTHFQSTQDPPSNATLAGYKRLITLSPLGSPKNGIKVQSSVQWTAKGKTEQLTLEERLYNWR